MMNKMNKEVGVDNKVEMKNKIWGLAYHHWWHEWKAAVEGLNPGDEILTSKVHHRDTTDSSQPSLIISCVTPAIISYHEF